MTRLLDQIDSPGDLRKLPEDALPSLAREIREEIINTVSKNGGHLAPSLGVVELSVAIHYVFNTPVDRLVWDVGHQAYAHKLLTGRRDRFHTLRTKGGLSGFPKREESEYDTFDTGHASTSISAGLGMSAAKEMKEEDARVIAVIGDGSLTGGLAYEGLNQAGELGKNLVVILNDNEMSISPNVGALSSFLSRKMTKRGYARFKQEVKQFLMMFPGAVGRKVIRLVQRSEGSFRGFISPSFLFEAFKFEYIGPIRGHRFDRLIEALENARDLGGPVLVHVITTKGKGYEPAEKNPTHFHGVGSFNIPTGDCPKAKGLPKTYTETFGGFMLEAAKKNDRFVVISAAMPEGTGLSEFQARYPDRFFDVGIAEQHAVTFAAGLAAEGYKPVVAIYSTFIQRAFDQIVHDVCLQNLPVFFCMDRGGLVGADGPTHHGVFDLSFFRAVPNMTLMTPKDESELQAMLAFGLEHPGPIAVRYPRGRGVGCSVDETPEIRLGKAEVLRPGSDIVLLAVGQMVYPCLEAAEILSGEGLDIGVVNARFIKPLDEELLVDLASKTPRLMTVEENTKLGGFGSAVCELLAEHSPPGGVKIRRLGVPDRFIEHGSQEELRFDLELDVQGICRAVKDMIAET